MARKPAEVNLGEALENTLRKTGTKLRDRELLNMAVIARADDG